MRSEATDGRRERTRTTVPCSLLPALALLLAGGCGGGAEELPVLFEAPSFALTDQAGDTLRASQLEGQAWVVHPFFINCRDVCPVTTGRMAGLRDSLAADGLLGDGARLVSVTVDPARDSTAALRRWAEQHGDSPPAHWAFLRGDPPEAVRSLVQDGFHLSAMMPGEVPTEAPESDEPAAGEAAASEAAPGGADAADDSAAGYQVLHASQVLLVDGRGRVRGTYEILRPDDFRQLVADARRLAR